MGVDTIGIVKGNFENQVFEVINIVRTALKNIDLGHGRSIYNLDFRFISAKSFSCSFAISTRGFTPWQIANDPMAINRLMYIHFDCHFDYSDVLKGDKLILSLGCDDQAKKIITAILQEFSHHAECYLIPDDSRDEFDLIPPA